MNWMRSLLLLIYTGLMLTSCAPAPPPPQATKRDETKEPWYTQTVEQLAAQNLKAKSLIKNGKPDDAAALIQSGEPLASRLLAVPRPTREAMEGASDLDDLYARMLLSNRNYGWARLFFQKNAARWKLWSPQTADTTRRQKEALAGIAECDRRMLQP
jgi:hypothetical protein